MRTDGQREISLKISDDSESSFSGRPTSTALDLSRIADPAEVVRDPRRVLRPGAPVVVLAAGPRARALGSLSGCRSSRRSPTARPPRTTTASTCSAPPRSHAPRCRPCRGRYGPRSTRRACRRSPRIFFSARRCAARWRSTSGPWCRRAAQFERIEAVERLHAIEDPMAGAGTMEQGERDGLLRDRILPSGTVNRRACQGSTQAHRRAAGRQSRDSSRAGAKVLLTSGTLHGDRSRPATR
jgi:hypothetical protein